MNEDDILINAAKEISDVLQGVLTAGEILEAVDNMYKQKYGDLPFEFVVNGVSTPEEMEALYPGYYSNSASEVVEKLFQSLVEE